jgi:DNA (cytosine-5)-methyltransferase 1
MSRPRLLDLFCGAGGCSVGYRRAGFAVVGVDVAPQPHYPFAFIKADAIEVMDGMLAGEEVGGYCLADFAAIHASPVCKRYSAITPARNRESHPDQIAPIRARLMAQDAPWVIENVPGAPLRPDLKLCGCMFALPQLKRERWFETSWQAFGLRQPCDHKPGDVVSVTGTGGGTGHTRAASVADWRRSMGIEWMSMGELSQAIPPAYTEYIGHLLLEHLASEAAS